MILNTSSHLDCISLVFIYEVDMTHNTSSHLDYKFNQRFINQVNMILNTSSHLECISLSNVY